MIEKYDPSLENFSDVFQQFESKEYRQYLSGCHSDWLAGLRDWSHFITLTFKDDVSIEYALKEFKNLIRILNSDLLGSHYTRIVGHSYFSYVCGVEYQTRGTPHFHFVLDKPFNFNLMHKYWFIKNGYLKVEKIYSFKESEQCINYSLKYSVKESEVIVFLQKNHTFVPFNQPVWWIEKVNTVSQLEIKKGLRVN